MIRQSLNLRLVRLQIGRCSELQAEFATRLASGLPGKRLVGRAPCGASAVALQSLWRLFLCHQEERGQASQQANRRPLGHLFSGGFSVGSAVVFLSANAIEKPKQAH